jgi:hypothetical protein
VQSLEDLPRRRPPDAYVLPGLPSPTEPTTEDAETTENAVGVAARARASATVHQRPDVASQPLLGSRRRPPERQVAAPLPNRSFLPNAVESVRKK